MENEILDFIIGSSVINLPGPCRPVHSKFLCPVLLS